MKVYISVDFEGVAGSTSWSSTNLGDLEHGPMAREMTLEAAAACRGALAAGATEIYIKDAHESGRNMDISLLPKEANPLFPIALQRGCRAYIPQTALALPLHDSDVATLGTSVAVG